MEHTKEPWHVGGAEKCTIYDQFSQRIANSFEGVMASQRSDMTCAANARRIVAAVNACASMPTVYLEQKGLPSVNEYLALEKQRDELAAALEEVLAAERFSSRPPETVMQAEAKLDRIRAAVKRAEAALAAVKGQ